ncbi:protein kinase [Luteimonas marina]|uniref:Protein kinase n=1 Tax=Luteimonas marina TaxID=488485 RepID=A0A5C5U0M9_9GAMM|nr:serine/threonine-protein kinase [Luteimonas marina]TWT19238.1 protein kinase [Luteimonas marina]
MSGGDTERRRQSLSIFEAVADLDPAARTRRLDALCGDDAQLRARVEAMLAADASRTEPFSGGAALWADAMGPGVTGGDAAADAARSGEQIGAWRITGLLGRGGMGAVHAVERADGAYVQKAALKRVQGGELSPSSRERFLRERQVLARLQHPHIATLLDGGFDAGGDPYFVMERVDGLPIDRWCDQHAFGLRARVVLFLQVLDAVQYAHRNLVVHRDLKPSNLLVTPEGQVKLLDFGIARELEEAGHAATATSDRAMTLQYASPEQLHNEPVTTATDLYQVGVVLYRLLSGRHPFGIDADTPIARQLQALSGDPEPITRSARQSDAEVAARRGETPASLARALDGSLEAIVHACLRRDPAARYTSAEMMAADLRAWLDDRPVAAARLGRTRRARLWLRRNRALAASAAAVLVALLAGTGVALWQAREAREQARIAEREGVNARATLQFLTDTLAAASPEQAMDTEVSVRQLLDHARGKIDQRGALDPRVRQPVQRMLGLLYGSLGEPEIASQLLAAGVAGVVPSTREDALALAGDLSAQVSALATLERGEEALRVARQAVALREAHAPDDGLQRMRSADDLATAHFALDQDVEAVAQWREAIAIAEALPDVPPLELIDVHHALANLLRERGDTAGALKLTEDGLAIATRIGVPVRSPLRVPLLRIRADAQIAGGRIADAEASVREAIFLQSAAVGGGGVQMGSLYNTLGTVLFEQGRFTDAADAFTRGHEGFTRAGGPPSERAAMLANLGSVWESAGDYPRAAGLFDQAIAALEEGGVTARDASRRALLRNHARVLLFTGRVAEAERQLAGLLVQAREIDGEDSLEAAWVVWQQLVVARRSGDVARGVPLLAEARRRWAAHVPPEHAVFAHALVTDAVFAEMRGELDVAERDLRTAAERLESVGKPIDVATTRAMLARVRLSRGDRAEARRLLDQALPVLRAGVLPAQVGRADAEALARRLGKA